MLQQLISGAWIIRLTDAQQRVYVKQLRKVGVTWARIGDALGVTRQSARDRFAYLEQD